VLNAVDPLFNVPIFETCFASGVTYLDMADALRAASGEAFEQVGVKLDYQFVRAAAWEEKGASLGCRQAASFQRGYVRR
jgi:saccharopine dehydrogenase-like NADP-dependent oxidoreductase